MRLRNAPLLGILLCLTLASPALASEEVTELAQKTGFRGNVSLSHSVGANTSIDPTSSALAELRYNFDAQRGLLLRQEVSKLYARDMAEEEWQAADTLLAFRYLQKSPWQDLSFAATASATLPVSAYSQKQEVLSIPGLSVQATQKLLGDRLLLSAGPFFRYHLNRYKTMKDDDGGRYLVRSRFGVDFSAQAILSEKAALAAAVQWAERTYEQAPYGNVPADHRYNVDLSAAYELNKKTSVAVGYTQTDLAEQLGRIDVYLFDVDASYYYAQLSYQVF